MIRELPWFFAFDHIPVAAGALAYAVGDNAASSWTNSSWVGIAADGTLGRNVFGVAYGNLGYNLRFDIQTGLSNRIVFGFRAKLYSAPNNNRICSFANAAGQELARLDSNGAGEIAAKAGGLTAFTTSGASLGGGWAYYEWDITLHASAGAVELRRNGAVIGTASGINTLPYAAPATILYLGGGSDIQYSYWTDLYLKSTAGYYGPIQMRKINPTADVLAQFTRSAGATNYETVDDPTTVTTDYNETTTLGNEDQFEAADLPGGVNSILAVVLGTVATATNGGAPLLDHTVEVSGTKATGADRTLGSAAYELQLTAFVQAPDSTPWSPTKVNGMRIGYKAA